MDFVGSRVSSSIAGMLAMLLGEPGWRFRPMLLWGLTSL